MAEHSLKRDAAEAVAIARVKIDEIQRLLMTMVGDAEAGLPSVCMTYRAEVERQAAGILPVLTEAARDAYERAVNVRIRLETGEAAV